MRGACSVAVTAVRAIFHTELSGSCGSEIRSHRLAHRCHCPRAAHRCSSSQHRIATVDTASACSGSLTHRREMQPVRPAVSVAALLVSLFLLSCGLLDRADGKFHVHLVPHTHNDVGWLKTVDQYFIGSNKTYDRHAAVQYILNSVIPALQANADRKFIYVEQGFFQRWWRQQTDGMQQTVRGLLSSGQLEFINGGWCMHDEGATHYIDMIDQTALGHRYIKQMFNATPSIGWQIGQPGALLQRCTRQAALQLPAHSPPLLSAALCRPLRSLADSGVAAVVRRRLRRRLPRPHRLRGPRAALQPVTAGVHLERQPERGCRLARAGLRAGHAHWRLQRAAWPVLGPDLRGPGGAGRPEPD